MRRLLRNGRSGLAIAADYEWFLVEFLNKELGVFSRLSQPAESIRLAEHPSYVGSFREYDQLQTFSGVFAKPKLHVNSISK